MSEETDTLFFEVRRTQRACVSVVVPKGVFFRRGEWWQLCAAGPRKCVMPEHFWDWLDDFADWKSIGAAKVQPFEVLGHTKAGEPYPTFQGRSAEKAWTEKPHHLLDATPYLSGWKEGEQ